MIPTRTSASWRCARNGSRPPRGICARSSPTPRKSTATASRATASAPGCPRNGSTRRSTSLNSTAAARSRKRPGAGSPATKTPLFPQWPPWRAARRACARPPRATLSSSRCAQTPSPIWSASSPPRRRKRWRTKSRSACSTATPTWTTRSTGTPTPMRRPGAVRTSICSIRPRPIATAASLPA